MRKRLLIALSIALVGGLLLAAAAALLVESQVVERRVRDRVVERLSRATSGAASIERLDLTLLPPGATIAGLDVRNGAGVVSALRVESATLTVHAFDLLRGRLRLRSVDAEGVELQLASGVDSPRDGGGPIDLTPISRMLRVRLSDGRVAVANRVVPFFLDARDVRIDAAPGTAASADGRGLLETGAVDLILGELQPQRIDRARARFVWKPPRVEIGEMRVEGASAWLTGSAHLGITPEGVTTRGAVDGWLRIDAVLPATDLAPRGAIETSATFRASVPGDWRVEGRLAGVGPVVWQELEWLDLSGGYLLAPGQIELRSVQGRTNGGTRVARADLARGAGGWSLAAEGRAALADGLARAGLPRDLARGTAEVSLRAEGPDVAALRWRLEAELDATDAGSSAAVAGRLDARGDPDSGTLGFDGTWGGSEASLSARWDGPLPTSGWQLEAGARATSAVAAEELVTRVVREARRRGVQVDERMVPAPRGALNASLELVGVRERPGALRLWASFGSPELAGSRFDSLELHVRRAASGDWSASGRLADERGGGLHGRARGTGGAIGYELVSDGIEWAALAPLFGESAPALPAGLEPRIGGAVFGSFVAGVPRARFVGRASGSLLDGTRLVGLGSGELLGRRLELARADLLAPGSLARVAGVVELPADGVSAAFDGRIDGELDLRLLSTVLGSVIKDADPDGVPRWEPALRGTLSARGRVAWPAELLPVAANAELRWSDAAVDGIGLPDGSARIDSGRDGASLVARIDRAQLVADVTRRADAAWVDGRVDWTGLETVRLREIALGRPSASQLAVVTTGSLGFAGPLADPGSWTGDGRIRRLDIDGPSFSSELTEDAGVALETRGRLTVSGRAPVTLRALRGGVLTVSGTLDLLDERGPHVSLDLRGESDLSLLELLEPDLVASGSVEISIDVRGPLADPLFDGRARIERGRLRLLSLDEALDDLTAEIELDGRRIELRSARARLGGGVVEAAGGLQVSGWVPGAVDVRLAARDVSLSLPRDIWGRYDADLQLVGTATDPFVRGQIRALAGRYTRPFEFGTPFARRRRIVDPGFGVSSWLARVGFQMEVIADESFLVRNDMARLATSVRLGVRGTAAQPLLAGTVSLLEGGRVDFRGTEYTVLSGQLSIDDLSPDPVRLRLRATADVRGYRIRLDLDASTERLDYQLSSTPALAEADILSLLVTGDTVSETGVSGLAGTDLATAYFGSELGELLFAGTARRLLGLNVFQIAPTRVDAEARPTARLTLGRRIDDRTVALYSTDLSSESRDVYRLERELTRSLSLSASSESTGGVGLDLRWLKRLGEGRVSTVTERPTAVRLDALRVEGLPEDIRVPSARRLGLRRGRVVSRADRIEARDRLARLLLEAGYLEARIEERGAGTPGGELELVYDVTPGSKWRIDAEGPQRAVRDVRKRLIDIWILTEFRPELPRETQRVAEQALAEQGFATAIVEVGRGESGRRVLELRVDPGPRVSVGRVELVGVESLDESEVRAQILSRPGPGWRLASRVTYRPQLLDEDVDAIRALYESKGYLAALVDRRIRFSRDGSEVVITFLIEEGPRALVSSVAVEGDWPVELGPATTQVPLVIGEVFLPDQLEQARRLLAGRLDEAGYYEAVVLSRALASGADVDVEFSVSSGPRAIVDDVVLEGLGRTRERVVRGALALSPGEPLTRRALGETERALFGLGLFRDVEVTHAPRADEPERRVVTVRVREVPPVSVLSSVGWDTEDKLSVSAALSHDNLTGRGRVGSVQVFGSSRRRGIRTTLEGRGLLKQSLEDLASLGWIEEQREGFTTETAELAVQIGTRRDRRRRWQFGYQLKDTRFKDVTLDPDALRDVLLSERGRAEPIRLGSLSAAWIRDRRDDPFLPASGWIARADSSLWARQLASEEEFARFGGRLGGYQPLGEHVTLVGSLRAGIAWPLRETGRVPLSERFFAGGADTLRGFERDKLGPLDAPGGNPLGGESLLLGSLEARWRVTEQFEVAAFVDLGNVWLEPGDLDLGDLRETWGVSLRLRTAVGPLRLGYGRKLDRMPGESSGELFIAIGETF